MEATEQAHEVTEDTHGHLERATKTLEEREEHLAQEWQKLEKEKQKVAASTDCSADDLVEINVGGDVVMTDRSTMLLAEGTLLAVIFSGRWDQSLKRDGAGRVFLDFSPQPFKAILRFLRALRDAKPGEHVAPPVVPPDYQEEYKALVKSLNLAEFLNTQPTHCPTGALACAQSTGGTCDGCMRCDGGVLRGGCGWHRCVVGGARLLGEDGSWSKAAWKVTVRTLGNHSWLCAGVTCNACPADNPYGEPTCWAWASHTTYLAGQPTQNDGWTGWAQEDVAVFQLNVSSGLRMFHRRSGQVHHIMQGVSADMLKQARVHFSFVCVERGTEVEVSQVTAEDLAEAGF